MTIPAPAPTPSALRSRATCSRAAYLCAAAIAWFLPWTASLGASDAPAPPLKLLYITGGGYHDYQTQAVFLTTNLTRLVNATFEAKFGLDILETPAFADPYDAVFYNLCEDNAPDPVLENALQATRHGKPAVLMHCSIHAFRNSPRIKDWETFCGLRSKVHDPYGPFTISKLDPDSPITRFLPADWKTAGDELYQTISIFPDSHKLLKAKSPADGREHIVCWTSQFGLGRVFATTLGHDMKTCSTPEFRQLLANGLLWACGKLNPDGTPAAGYGGTPTKP